MGEATAPHLFKKLPCSWQHPCLARTSDRDYSCRVKTASRTVGFIAGAAVLACGATPQIKSTADYREDTLAKSRVLFVPLAVSEALGDQRTGIILSDHTRVQASDAACSQIAASSGEAALICLDAQQAAAAPAFTDVQRLFALDEPIPPEVWEQLRRTSNVELALLFRPEAVSSSRDVSRAEELRSPIVAVGSGAALATSLLVSGMAAAATTRTVTTNETELSYTVSASLVDLRTGKLLKVGLHSASDSRTVKRNLGYAEAPPAAPLLEKIMVELGGAVLDD